MRPLRIIIVIMLAVAPAGIQAEEKLDVINKRGVDLGDQNRLDEAIKEFDKSLDFREKAVARVLHNKGYALERKGNNPEAIKCYEEALKRNPLQMITSERLGYLYYLTEDYENAVTIGEDILKRDPNNKSVARWLPDAFKKRLEKRQDYELAEKRRRQEEERRRQEELDAKKLADDKSIEKRQVLFVSYDVMLRTAYYYGFTPKYGGIYYSNHKVYKVQTDRGLTYDLPNQLTVKVNPVDFFEINIYAGKPFLGASSPPLITHNETLELLFHIKTVTLGFGGMANHMDYNVWNWKRYRMNDYKVGIIIGYQDDRSSLKLTWYPRVILSVYRSDWGKHLNCGLLKLDYEYYFKSNVKIYFMFNAQDYYVIMNRKLLKWYFNTFSLANYWGIYEMALGVTFTKPFDISILESHSLSVEWMERFYLEALNYENPYTLAPNGQGWFGINLKKWTKGKPFSGFHALSQVVSFRFEENFTKNFFMYQKAIIEICDWHEDHHEFNLQVGFGYKM